MRIGFDPIYENRPITDLRDLLYSGLKLYGDNPLFLEKSKIPESMKPSCTGIM